MDHIVRGVLNFRKNVYPEHKDLFGALADKQNPDVLFVTCSDSRIDPNMVTGSHPGDLFICRNAGNVIPPHSNETGSMTASTEYAVAVLGVRHIIVCGHTDCGAITGALDTPSLKGLPHVKEWLGHCRSAIEIVRERHGIPIDECLDIKYLNEAIEENVLQQVQHLRTHPVVAAKLATGKIEIHGWVYDIKSGSILCCGRDSLQFKEFEQYYADEIANLGEA
ncbi:carbonic anhydrase [Marinobacter adhaerens]|uniref:Carbonic anhydrase n=1 Tax=Marinobacter adhaerens TaxID=1033846 RepID=A0A851HWE7_9GAMM|nr:carbonic anhydrase [Marinobacter adhaerens]NWN91305.1 carbonic anhydrase [Marinobacter adhaerens]